VKPQGSVSCAVRIHWSGKTKVVLLLGQSNVFCTVRTHCSRKIKTNCVFFAVRNHRPTDAPLPEHTENPSCGEKSKVGPFLGFWKNSSLREMTRPPSVALFPTLWVSDGTDDSENMWSQNCLYYSITTYNITAFVSWKSGNGWAHKTTREPLNEFSWKLRHWITLLKFVHQAQFRLPNIYGRFELTYSLHLQGQAVFEF